MDYPSPMQVLYDLLKPGSPHAEPFNKDAKELTFETSFPAESHENLPSIDCTSTIEWRNKALFIHIVAEGQPTFAPWPSDAMQDFFEEVTNDVKPFLTHEWAGGNLLPFITDEENSERLKFGYQAVITCSTPLSKEALVATFSYIIPQAGQALLFTRPIFVHLSKHGKVPNKEERIRMLSIEFGNFELFCRKSSSVVNRPRGWFADTYPRSPLAN